MFQLFKLPENYPPIQIGSHEDILTHETITPVSITNRIEQAKDGEKVVLPQGEYILDPSHCTESKLWYHLSKSIQICGEQRVIIHTPSLFLEGCNIRFKNVALWMYQEDANIWIESGDHIFNDVAFSFGAANVIIRPKAAVKFHATKFIHFQDSKKSVDTTLIFEGNGELINCKFHGNPTSVKCAIEPLGAVVLSGTSFHNYMVGVKLNSGKDQAIESCRFSFCAQPIVVSAGANIAIRKCTMEHAVIGIDTLVPCSLEVTENEFEKMWGPAVTLPSSLKEKPVIKNNTFLNCSYASVISSGSEKLAEAIKVQNTFKLCRGNLVIQRSPTTELILWAMRQLLEGKTVTLKSLEEAYSGTKIPDLTHIIWESGILSILYDNVMWLGKPPIPSPRERGQNLDSTSTTTEPEQTKHNVEPTQTEKNSEYAAHRETYNTVDEAIRHITDSTERNWIYLCEGDHHLNGNLLLNQNITFQTYRKAHLFLSNVTLGNGHLDIRRCKITITEEFTIPKDASMQLIDCDVTIDASITQSGILFISKCNFSCTKAIENMFFLEGWTSRILDSTFDGCFLAQELILAGESSVILSGNTIKNATRGIGCLSNPNMKMEHNFVTHCQAAVAIRCNSDETAYIEIHANTISHCAMGIVAWGTLDLNIFNNTITHVAGPAVFVSCLGHGSTFSIKKNKFSVGKTVGVVIPDKRHMKSTERENEFSRFAMGSVCTAKPKDSELNFLLHVFMAFNLDQNKLGQLGNFLQKNEVPFTKLLKSLQNYPGIFKATDEVVTWSDSLYEFPEPQPKKKKSAESTNNNNAQSAQVQQLSEDELNESLQHAAQENIVEEENRSQAESIQENPRTRHTEAATIVEEEQTSEEWMESNKKRRNSAKSKQSKMLLSETKPPARQPTPQMKNRNNNNSTEGSSAPNVQPSSPQRKISSKASATTSKKSTPPSTPKPKRQDHSQHARKVFDRTGGVCYLCRKPMVFENRQQGQEGAWHMDHVMPFSKYPELDIVENLMPAHINCDSCKGANHLQSIVNEADFNLLTMNLASLHPEVAEEVRAAKALYKQQNNKLPNLLNSDQFPPLSPAPKQSKQPASPKTSEQPKPTSDNNNNNSQKYQIPEKFTIKFSDIEMSSEMLGSGAFSTVWKAKYKGTPVAVKRINGSMTEQESKVFQKEVSILGELRHPNVILMIGICVSPDPCCIVTELFERKSLQHVLDSAEPLTEKDWICTGHCKRNELFARFEYHTQLADHEGKKIIHRDLKPLNVMVDNSGVCKLADFGLSGVLSQTTNGSFFASNAGPMGSIVYMAPESLAENSRVEFASDVYSFGITFWQIYTRTPPYQKILQTGLAGMVAIARDVPQNKLRPELPKDCLEGSSLLMTLCWANEPKDRPPFENIVQMLEKLLQ